MCQSNQSGAYFFTETVRLCEQFVWFQNTDLNLIPVIMQCFLTK